MIMDVKGMSISSEIPPLVDGIASHFIMRILTSFLKRSEINALKPGKVEQSAELKFPLYPSLFEFSKVFNNKCI